MSWEWVHGRLTNWDWRTPKTRKSMLTIAKSSTLKGIPWWCRTLGESRKLLEGAIRRGFMGNGEGRRTNYISGAKTSYRSRKGQ